MARVWIVAGMGSSSYPSANSANRGMMGVMQAMYIRGASTERRSNHLREWPEHTEMGIMALDEFACIFTVSGGMLRAVVSDSVDNQRGQCWRIKPGTAKRAPWTFVSISHKRVTA